MQRVCEGDAVGRAIFRDANIIKVAGGVKIADVLINRRRAVRITFFDANICANKRFANRLGSDVSDRDSADAQLRKKRRREGEEKEK